MKKNRKERPVRTEYINPVYKDRVKVLETSASTGGLYSLGELEISPGGGNQLHVHKAFTETFTAIKGTLGVRREDESIYLSPGDSMTIPPGTPHHFFNASNEKIVCHVKFTPGHSGFEKGLAIGYGLAADGLTDKKGRPKKFTHLALVISLTDTRPSGFLGLLMPIFSWIAKKERKKGTEEMLLEKYYYQ